MIAAYPKLSKFDFGLFRVIGHGLGNLLFPWARAVVAAHQYDLRLVWPTWPQVQVGPILRREQDARLYADLFARPADYMGGAKKLRALVSWRRLPESALADHVHPTGDALAVFSGMHGHFAAILDQHELVGRELRRLARPEHLVPPAEIERAIAVHVRLGDFGPAPTAETLQSGQQNFRIPLDWYVAQVKKTSAILEEAPVLVFSDGADGELAPLLSLPRVRRAPHGSSLAHMLWLARGRVLIASGSTFSMWASYLGRMPVIWYPGQLRQRLYTDNTEAELSAEAPLPERFARAISP